MQISAYKEGEQAYANSVGCPYEYETDERAYDEWWSGYDAAYWAEDSDNAQRSKRVGYSQERHDYILETRDE